MKLVLNRDVIFAATSALFSAACLLIWIPTDIETGMIETFRRQTSIGDAFLPVIACAAILASSLISLVMALRQPSDTLMDGPGFVRKDVQFMILVLAIAALALALMYWLGPLSTVFAEGGYRQLRATFPFKYIGYFVGGTLLQILLMRLVEGRFSLQRSVIAAATTLSLILLFDVPFDTLLLPPNGDW